MAASPPALSLLSAYFLPPSGLASNALLTEAAVPLPLSLQPHAHFPPTPQPSLPFPLRYITIFLNLFHRLK